MLKPKTKSFSFFMKLDVAYIQASPSSIAAIAPGEIDLRLLSILNKVNIFYSIPHSFDVNVI